MLHQNLFDFVHGLARHWRGCTQEVEGVNSMLKALINRAPSISLQLASARLAIRKALRMINPNGASSPKWSDVKADVETLVDECVRHYDRAEDIIQEETRWGPPLPADVQMQPPPLCAPSTKPNDPNLLWACSMHKLFFTNYLAKVALEDSLKQCLVFSPSASEAWVCCASLNNIGRMMHCAMRARGETAVISKPLRFEAGVRVIEQMHTEVNAALHPVPIAVYKVQWKLTATTAEGRLRGKEDIISK